MKKKKEEIYSLEHACILCKKRNACKFRLPFPDDCDVNDCKEYELDETIRKIAP